MSAPRRTLGEGDGVAREAAVAEARPSARAADLVVTAPWAGLVVGLIELALFEARVRLTQHGLARKNAHFLWMIPVANLALFGVAGLALAALARALPRKVGSLVAGWLLCVLALTVPLLSIPGLRLNSCLLLALGLSAWVGPTLRAHARGFRAVVWASVLPLGLVVLALGGVAFGRGFLASRAGATVGKAPAGAPDVLLVVMDTVRADATSLDASARGVTPNLAALAARGVRFDRAIAPAPWTLPSHASFFTGRWPSELKVGPDRALDGRFPTVAEYLGRHGYATAGFVANTAFCTEEYGLGRGFGHYEDYVVSPLETLRSSALGWLLCRRLVPVLDRLCTAAGREANHPLEATFYRKDAAEINRAALRWIERQGDRPYFAFLNYLDAHDPYLLPRGAGRGPSGHPADLAERRALRDWIGETPRGRTPEEIRLARDAYDDCLRYLDGQLGQLVAELGRLGRLDRTVILVTSDHGEHFGEHARDGRPLVGHRQAVYQPEVHVPLAIVAPGRVAAGTAVAEAVSLRDLPATIVDLAGLRDGSPFPGRTLLPTPGGGSAATAREAPLAEYSSSLDRSAGLRYQPGAPGLLRAVVAEGKVYIRQGDGIEELYDLGADPGESRNLARTAENRTLLDRFRATLDRLSPPG